MTDEELAEEIGDVHANPPITYIERARAAGARGPLTFVGAGASGVVLCDAKGRAFKVARHYPDCGTYETLEREYDWMRAAHLRLPADLARHVAKPIAFDEENVVLLRACVDGRRGGWGTRGLGDVYDRLVKAMRPLGWGHPEFKEDSFVVQEDGLIVMVDAGHALRLGRVNLAYAKEVVAGKRRCVERDVVFGLQQDVNEGLITEEEAAPVIAQLQALAAQKDTTMYEENPTRPKKKNDKIEGEFEVFDHRFRSDSGTISRVSERIQATTKDYGSDPLGDLGEGERWRMVPSGDIVDREELYRRLPPYTGKRYGNPAPSFKDTVRRDIDRAARERDDRSLRNLRRKLADLRSRHRALISEVGPQCRAAAAKHAARLRKWADATEKKAVTKCALSNDVHVRALEIVTTETKAEIERELRDREALKSGRKRKGPKRATAKERASESDDEVESNIPPDTVPLWERVKKTIKGSARMSRTEAFLHYAEEHPDEVIEALDDDTDAQVAKLVREQYRHQNPVEARAPEHGEIVMLSQDEIHAPRRGDMRRAKEACGCEKQGDRAWAKKVLAGDEDGGVVDVSFEDGVYELLDGHKRLYATGILGAPVQARVNVKRLGNPWWGKKKKQQPFIRGDEVSFIQVGAGSKDSREIKVPATAQLVHDPSGKVFRRCDVLILAKRKRDKSVDGPAQQCANVDTSEAENYYPSVVLDCNEVLDRPRAPWHRLAHLDGIRYRRWIDLHDGRGWRQVPFEHPFDPPVDLFVSDDRRAWKVALPDGCILDERGLVFP